MSTTDERWHECSVTHPFGGSGGFSKKVNAGDNWDYYMACCGY